MHAIQVTETGGPEVLRYTEVPAPAPNDDEVLVDVIMAGVNYIDTYYREGIYNAATPFIPGFEGTGRVIHDPKGKLPRARWWHGTRLLAPTPNRSASHARD